MTLLSLIQKVGPENIRFQHLSDSIVGARFLKTKNATRIIFDTEGNQVGPILKGENRCFILWIPEDKLPK